MKLQIKDASMPASSQEVSVGATVQLELVRLRSIVERCDHATHDRFDVALRRVTAVLAHELRNPLSVLQAGLELMDDDAADEHS